MKQTKTKLNQMLNYLVLSDIHLGRLNVPTEYMTGNLFKYFKVNNKLFKKLDLIIIAGDVYDCLLRHGSDEANMSTEFLLYLIKFCKENDIVLRILEGTPSHDWKQCSSLNTLIENNPVELKNLDFKYVSELTIEHMDRFNIDILYIPDEWRDNPDETLKEVYEAMNKNKITQVDLSIMHGHFKYQLPKMILDGHDEESYLNITRFFIHIGHVHTFSKYDRIIANGSFGRLAHGEEEDKGGVVCRIEPDGDMSFIFIANTEAMVFDTIDIDNDMSVNSLKILLRDRYPVNKKCNVRLRLDNSNISDNITDVVKAFKHLNITTVKKTEKVINKEDVFTPIGEVIEITPNNITKLLLEEIGDINDVTKEELVSELNEVI